MKTNTKVYLILIILLLSSYIYIFIGLRNKDKNKISIKTEYQYITDTIYKNIPYKVPINTSTHTEPITLIRYVIDSSKLDSLRLLLSEKNLIIIGLRDSIHISNNYIKNFPKNPKLLSLSLFKDSLTLDLLNIDGQVNTNIWPIYLDKYSYQWNLDGLSRSEIGYNNNKKLTLNYFLGSGYNFIEKTPYLSGKINLEYSRIQLYGGLDIGLLNNYNQVKVGLEYKINGKFKN